MLYKNVHLTQDGQLMPKSEGVAAVGERFP